MLYSSAIYPSEETTLEQAQEAKIVEIISKLDIQKDHHVLEVGSGWGTLAIEMAKRTGCKVTTITVSQKQFEFVKERLEIESLKIRLKLF